MANTLSYDIVFEMRGWQTLNRKLKFEPNKIAIGSYRRLETPTGAQLLVDEVNIVSPPNGNGDRRFGNGTLIVSMKPRKQWCGARELLADLKLRPSDQFAMISLTSDDPGCWDACAQDYGRTSEIDEIRVVEPGMPRIRRADPKHPAPPTKGRWSRTIGGLNEDVWPKLHESHVVLIGCGGNGSQLAMQLACLGVGRLTIVEPDTLEIENLDRMPGVVLRDVGRNKGVVLAEKLTALRPDLAVRCIKQSLLECIDQVRGPAQLLVSCVDDDAARLAASWLSRERIWPHLDVATRIQKKEDGEFERTGDCRFLLPRQGCVACIGGLDDPERCLYEIAAPPGALHRGEPVIWSSQRAGSLVSLNGLVVSAAVQDWLDFLACKLSGSTWHRIALTPSGIASRREQVTAATHCTYCNEP